MTAKALLVVALFALALPAPAAQPTDELRVALVIGNSAYPAGALLNPSNDARAMSESLAARGFAVIEVRDATKLQMEAAIARLRETLRGRQGVGMLYYAGHGLQLDWRNYMVPVDAKLRSAADVPGQTVDVQQVIDAFKASGNRMNIVVLDACRDNPFPATTAAKGLAQMDAPPGTLLAFATAPGNVAEDGDAALGNGLYTRYLVQEIKRSAAKIEDVFKRVRLQVRQRSSGRQVPWESTSLEDDFYFDPNAQAQQSREADSLATVEAALMREKADWDRIKSSTQADDFYAYLQKYPAGLISEQAQFRLDQLQRSRITAPPRADGIVMLASGVNRFMVGDELVFERTNELDQQMRSVKSRVTKADDLRVEFDGGVSIHDQAGSVFKDRRGVKDPGLLMTPADLAIGKRWRAAFTNTTATGTTTNFYDFHVLAIEEVTVPAGTFKAFKIQRSGQARAPGGKIIVLTGTMWIDPATMYRVRNESASRLNGRITGQESERLLSFTRMPRTP